MGLPNDARFWLVCITSMALAAVGCGENKETATTSADATTDAGQADQLAGGCADKPSCLTKNGQEDPSLCPAPASDWLCVDGCCQEKFVCDSDEQCTSRLGTEACADERFTCGCDQDTGECVQTMCQSDGQCPEGKVCSQGGCIDPLDDADLKARLLRPIWIARPGASLEAVAGLGAQALDSKGNTKPNAKFDFTLATNDGFSLAGGKLVAGDKPGKTTLTATVQGSKQGPSNAATLWNLGPVPADHALRVTAIDDRTMAPLAGKVVVVGLADAATPAEAIEVALADGQALFDNVEYPCDVHVLTEGHGPVSILRHTAQGPSDLVVPAPVHHFAELVFDGTGTLQKDQSTLLRGDLVTGEIAYPGSGEAALGVTSLGFGPALLSFGLDAILGPEVRRPFDDEAIALINPEKGKPQEVPGGVTFLLGKPVLTSFVLAAPGGQHILWTLAGRLALQDLMAQVGKIFNAVEEGLEVGKLVGVLLPYLGGLQSQVVFDVEFGEKLTEPLRTQDLAPAFPLGHAVAVDPGPLPKAGETGWADIVFAIGGAMLPDGTVVPLGLTAGADQAEDEAPDGRVDGSVERPGNQAMSLAVAPLHSGLRFGDANHMIVTAAVVLGGKAADGTVKKEAASIVLSTPGVLPAEYKVDAFMPLPAASSFEPDSATLAVQSIAGADLYRATLFGSQGAQWQILLPPSAAEQAVVLPDLTAWGAPVDLRANPKRVLVGAFELHSAKDWAALVGPEGLPDLVRLVKRTAFYDAAP